MSEISRVALFGKLGPIAYKAVEGATVFCKLRGNPYVELVHWIHQIMQHDDTDLHRIIRRFELNPSKLAADMTAALDRLAASLAKEIADIRDDLLTQIDGLTAESQAAKAALAAKVAELDNAVARVESFSDELDANDAPAPTDPETPADPEQPEEPVDPEPGDGEPTDPETPANPEQPSEPQPEPEQPVDPDAPVQ